MTVEDMPIFQVMVVGADHVGKTTLRERFVRDYIQSPPTRQKERKHLRRSLLSHRSKGMGMELLDLFGTDFVGLRDMHIMSCEGFILLYSIDDFNSFQQLPRFYQQIHRIKETHTPILLMGNKKDNHSHRQVSEAAAQEYALQIQAGHVEISLKEASPEQCTIAFRAMKRMMEEQLSCDVPLRTTKGKRISRKKPRFISLRKKLSWSLRRTESRFLRHSLTGASSGNECPLPKDLLIRVFQYLPHADLCQLQLVCSSWYHIIMQCMREDWFRRKRMQSLYILELPE